jgi:hypothetical protein
MKWRKALLLAPVLASLLLVGCNNRSWKSGDRVLVAKFAYDASLGEPKSFDVVVFKYPKGPVENGIPKNYIKRLLGLPGQILAIFFGQLFFFQPGPGEPPLFDDLADPTVKANDLWQKHFMHINDSRAVELFEQPGKFQILRKSPEVMLALRRIVYDNDYPARDLHGRLPPRWNPDKTSGWVPDKNNGFSHAGAKQGSIDWLRYQHITRPFTEPVAGLDRKPELITDFMDYNAGVKGRGFSADYLGANWVGDLMLDCQVTVDKAEGEFWLELSKGIHRFQARFDLSSGLCTLYQVTLDGKKKEMANVTTRVQGPGEYSLRLANFDSRLTLWVDHDLPFGQGKDYDPPEIRQKGENNLDLEDLLQRRGPTKENDLEPASVGTQGASVKINHLRLWRDTYYTLAGPNSDARFVFPPPDVWADPAKWEPLRKLEPLTMYVQPGHYLCLGDNSPASSDSREWGVVPQRLLLGRALLVYFPLNRAGPIR